MSDDPKSASRKQGRGRIPRNIKPWDDDDDGYSNADEAVSAVAKNDCRAQHPSDPRVRRTGAEANQKIDWREQLYNDGDSGPIERVQLPGEMITSLRGIPLDFDPGLFRVEVLSAKARKDPVRFSNKLIRPWLQRHPVLAKAERRVSGRGVHAILWFDHAIEFSTEGDRQRWAAIVRVIQKLLPTDPDCPGITATTRPIGSVNSKNGAKVRRLFKGEPVSADEVLDLFEQARAHPLRTVATLLFGAEQMTPCPVCEEDGTRLDALDWIGNCYGGCGKVRLGQLFDVFLKPRPSQIKE